MAHGYLENRAIEVIEFPKSGGTWLARLLSTALEWPFFDDAAFPPSNNCVVRGHHLPATATPVSQIYLFRDARDTYVSLFHHRVRHWGENVHYRRAWLRQNDDSLNAGSIQAQMARFLQFEHAFAGRRGSGIPVPWGAHIEAWQRARASGAMAAESSYEELRGDTAGEVARLIEVLTGTRPPHELASAVSLAHDFELRRRAGGVETGSRSFLRSGVAGGWNEAFTRESGRVLQDLYGEQMKRLGYVHDEEWWQGLAEH